MVPMAIDSTEFTTELMATNISGADVPSAMMVNPTTKSLMPSFLAILDDDSTNLSEPNTRVIIDNTSSEIFKNTFILYRLNL